MHVEYQTSGAALPSCTPELDSSPILDGTGHGFQCKKDLTPDASTGFRLSLGSKKPMTAQLRIGDLAKQARVNLETIRYYERQSLLPKPPRTAAGYRMFPPDAVRRVRFIKRAQELGFSLKEIKELLALRIDSRTDCSAVRRRAQAKLADVEEKIRTMRAIRRVLAGLTSVCPGRGPVSECPILESLDSDGALRDRALN
jgi:Hg(II)-responsive transcriptional regulator